MEEDEELNDDAVRDSFLGGFPVSDDSTVPEDTDDSISLDEDTSVDDDQPTQYPSTTVPADTSDTSDTPGTPKDDDKIDKSKVIKVSIIIGMVVLLLIGLVVAYKVSTKKPESASQVATSGNSQVVPTPSTPNTTPNTQEPKGKDNSGRSMMTLESQAPNIDKLYQGVGIVQEKHIYLMGNQRYYALSMAVSNVPQPMITFVSGDDFSKIQDGDKYNVTFGQYSDGVFAIRALYADE
jgi:hypothetical protein